MTGQSRSQPAQNSAHPALNARLQKTRLCQFYMKTTCKDGAACRFAHGTEELAKTPDLSKTSICPELVKTGKCTKPGCSYAHSADEIRTTNFCHKTTQCIWHAMGKCRKGAACRFAHGDADLKPSLNEVVAREKVVTESDNSQGHKKQGQKKKTKQQQQPKPQKLKNTEEMPEPMFIRSSIAMPMDPEPMPVPFMQAPQRYIQSPSGYGSWMMAPPGLTSPMVPEPAAEGDKVKKLSMHIKSLTKKIKTLEDNMRCAMRSDSDRSTFGGSSSNASGSSSDDLVQSDASRTSSDNEDNAWGAWGNEPMSQMGNKMVGIKLA